MGASEFRQGARFAATLWVAVEGVDRAYSRREGNLSTSGVFIESDRALGRVGSVQLVRLATLDRQHAVETMARVVRAVTLDDLDRGQRTGVAFEFRPESPQRREQLASFVLTVAAEQATDGLLAVEGRADVHAAGEEVTRQGTVEGLGQGRMLLHTRWPARVGDSLEVEIQGPGGHPVPIVGTVQHVTEELRRSGATYRVELTVDGSTLRDLAGKRTVSELLSSLMVELTAGAEPVLASPQRRAHMTGSLDRVRLASLLSLAELESMTGVFHLARDERRARVVVHEGRVLGVEGHPQGDLRDTLGELLRWTDGSFEFHLDDVDPAGRAGHSITGLLLDLARERDESTR